jgi:hypothetical protein
MEFIRYNSLRDFADLIIDAPSGYYRDAGIDLFPAGGGFPAYTPEISPARIFIKTDFLSTSLDLLRSLKKPFHLLTGTSDIPGCAENQIAAFLKENTRIISWSGMNLEVHFPWMLSVPIGLEERGRPGREPENLPYCKNTQHERCIDIYVPHFSDTHPNRRSTITALMALGSERLTIEQHRIPLSEYADRLAHANYTLCLPGNGFDTIRLYEALISGSVPIVMPTPILPLHIEMGAVSVTSVADLLSLPHRPAHSPDPSKFSYTAIRNKVFEHQMEQYRVWSKSYTGCH